MSAPEFGPYAPGDGAAWQTPQHWASYPPPPPAPPKKHTARNIAFVAGLAAAAIIGAVATTTAVAHHIGSSHQSGFYTADDLDPSVQARVQDNFDTEFPGAQVTGVGCVDVSARVWDCHVDFTDPDSSMDAMDLVVNVSSDHQTWVSHAS